MLFENYYERKEVFKVARTYNRSWDVKEISINFNEKQWRQDFAAFVKNKKLWGYARVSRSKRNYKSNFPKETRLFEVYDEYGSKVIVYYKNQNEIVDSTHKELVKQYFEERKL